MNTQTHRIESQLSPLARFEAYVDLLKLKVPELALYSFSAVAMVLAAAGKHQRLLSVELLFLFFTFCCTTLTNVLDDISGYTDGVDQLNVTRSKRNIVKPLLTGTLSVNDARNAAAVLAGVAGILAFALSARSHHPLFVLVALVALIGVVTQYSFGLKLSYRAMGELVIIYGIAASILIPYGLATESFPPLSVWWVAIMAGLPYAAQIVCSNAVDLDGDKAAGRKTLTVLLGIPRARWVSVFFLGLFWCAFAVGVSTGQLPKTFLLCLPLALGHFTYLRRFWKGQLVEARLLSFKLVRVQLVIFPAALLLSRWL